MHTLAAGIHHYFAAVIYADAGFRLYVRMLNHGSSESVLDNNLCFPESLLYIAHIYLAVKKQVAVRVEFGRIRFKGIFYTKHPRQRFVIHFNQFQSFFGNSQVLSRNHRYRVSIMANLLYLGIFPSVIAFLFWNTGVSKVGPTQAAAYYNLIPVFNILLASFLLNEKLELYHIIGGLSILVGLVITSIDQYKIQNTATKQKALLLTCPETGPDEEVHSGYSCLYLA